MRNLKRICKIGKNLSLPIIKCFEKAKVTEFRKEVGLKDIVKGCDTFITSNKSV